MYYVIARDNGRYITESADTASAADFVDTESADNIDYATYIKDRLNDVGITDVVITAEVNIQEEEAKFYGKKETNIL